MTTQQTQQVLTQLANVTQALGNIATTVVAANINTARSVRTKKTSTPVTFSAPVSTSLVLTRGDAALATIKTYLTKPSYRLSEHVAQDLNAAGYTVRGRLGMPNRPVQASDVTHRLIRLAKFNAIEARRVNGTRSKFEFRLI